METLAPLPPDITITREDVRALPISGHELLVEPRAGRSWYLLTGPVVDARACFRWADMEAGTPVEQRHAALYYFLTPFEAAVAERAFLWRTALASDAALCDIAEDIAEEHVPMQVVDVARRIAALRAELDAYEGRAGQA